MPSSIYKSLRLGALEPTGIVIQLASRSIAHLLGILEDMLVQVSDMNFQADFYVLDMKNELSSKEPTLILGRPFLKIARTKIDMHARTLFMEFGDNRVEYTIFKAMKHPKKNHLVFYLDVIDQLGSRAVDIASVVEMLESVNSSRSLAELLSIETESIWSRQRLTRLRFGRLQTSRNRVGLTPFQT
ncbi:hypothetical protein CR513_38504, partial [Mucuna pruriens]